ncbi:MAG: DNA-processing protein DprA [Gemmatimonadota bacterium]
MSPPAGPPTRGSSAARKRLDTLFRLLLLPGIGPVRLRDLVRRHGSPEAALGSDDPDVARARAALVEKPGLAGRIGRAITTVERLGIRVLTLGGPAYPERLLHLHDPPFCLFALGDLSLLERPLVGVVGTRGHTEYGGEMARLLAAGLSRAGVVVVSGLARGIDGLAHGASLAGGTVAVLGCGVDVVYPREHARLQALIGRQGLLLSEFLPGEPPDTYRFPQRNRLIAALARAIVVVEAGAKSGALSTARHAADLGRDIMAVPGRADRATSVGTNALIRDGSRLVTGPGDVLEELGLPGRSETVGPRGGAPSDAGRGLSADPLWRTLRDEPRPLDDIAAAAGLEPGRALAGLLALELEGHARQLPGGRFARAQSQNLGTATRV